MMVAAASSVAVSGSPAASRSELVTSAVTSLVVTPGAGSPGAGGLAARSGSTGPPVCRVSRRVTWNVAVWTGSAGFSQFAPSVRVKVYRRPCTWSAVTVPGSATAGSVLGLPSCQEPPVSTGCPPATDQVPPV